MKIRKPDEKAKFLRHEKFYSPETKSYCLGKTLDEAAEIMQTIILDKEKEDRDYVGKLVERVCKNRTE